jgi:hypothetical protein
VSILGWFVEGGLLGQYQLCHQSPKLFIIIDIQGRFLLHNLVSGSHEFIRQKVYHARWSQTTRSFRLVFWVTYLFSLDPRLLQFPVPQALNPSLLAFPQGKQAPLSLLPDVLVFFFFLISPSQVSLPFPRVINDLNYFLAPIVIRMHPSNSLMDGSVIDSLLPIFKVFVTALRAVPQCGEFQTLILAVSEECAPQCARSCSRVYCSSSFLRTSSSNLRLSSSRLRLW